MCRRSHKAKSYTATNDSLQPFSKALKSSINDGNILFALATIARLTDLENLNDKVSSLRMRKLVQAMVAAKIA